MNIYVGNLPYSVKSAELKEAFEAFGAVSSAEVIFDRRTKRSRGYGFVEMDDDLAGRRAIEALNGSDFKGRELRVDESQPREEKTERRANGHGAGPRADHDGGRGHGRDSAAARSERGHSPAAPEPTTGGVIGFFKRLFG
ncbi:MAG: RNA-binding protein [Gammaproteobacteria bacterium]